MMERENYFHKPLANINWYAQWSDKVSMFTTVYYSGGKGGGTGTYGSIRYNYDNGDPRVLDWNSTVARNMASDTAFGILRNSVNNQYTIGAIAKLKVDWTENLKTVFGVDWRTASVDHFREVRDLLGGKFYIDDADEFNPEKKVVLGDKIAYDFTNTIDWIGGFAQAEYHNENITAYITLGISNIKYKTDNRFLMDPDDATKNLVREADPFMGYQVKGGLSYNIDERWTVFGNAGYVSKVPILDAAINDNTGDLIEDPQNETFVSGELGMNYRSVDGVLNANVNVYHTTWNDRTVNFTEFDNITGDEGIFTVLGLNAIHQGIELDLAVQPNDYFRLDGAASVGNWRNTNNPEAIYKEYGNPDADTTINIFAKDLRTGDAPQTQFALAGTVFPCKGLYLTISFRHYANYWSDWNVSSRTDADDVAQSWKIPAYSVWDLHAGYQLPMKSKTGVEIFGHIFNLFDALYISDAVDDSQYNGFSGASNHTAANAEVFMGLPFSFNLGVKISVR